MRATLVSSFFSSCFLLCPSSTVLLPTPTHPYISPSHSSWTSQESSLHLSLLIQWFLLSTYILSGAILSAGVSSTEWMVLRPNPCPLGSSVQVNGLCLCTSCLPRGWLWTAVNFCQSAWANGLPRGWDSGEAFLLGPVKCVSATKTTKPGDENWSEC